MTFVEFSEVFRNFALAVAAVIGAWFAWKRLKPPVEQARLARRDQEREVFRLAVADLSSEHVVVRLGAVFVLEDVAIGVPHLSRSALQALCVFLRYQNSVDTDKSGPSADVSAAIESVAVLQKLGVKELEREKF